MPRVEAHKLPPDIVDKLKVVNNVFKNIDKQEMKLKAIADIVATDWGYSVTDDMVRLPSGEYREFTQEQAEEMSRAISKIYMIAHTITCKACDSKWDKRAELAQLKEKK